MEQSTARRDGRSLLSEGEMADADDDSATGKPRHVFEEFDEKEREIVLHSFEQIRFGQFVAERNGENWFLDIEKNVAKLGGCIQYIG